MARICLYHWKASEAQPILSALRGAGHEVDYREKPGTYGDLRRDPPDLFLIDLSRQPSMGRELAVFFRGSKSLRLIPIVFVDGDPAKVAPICRLMPDAQYTSLSRVKAAVRSALAHPPVNPIRPPQMEERIAGRSTAQKLGIAADSRVAVIDPPPDYARAIGEIPEGARYVEDSTAGCKLALWFVHDPAEFQASLPRMRRLCATTRLWIAWRKGKRDGLNETIIRQGAIDVGLVDYKICSINETWSAMLFAVKKPK